MGIIINSGDSYFASHSGPTNFFRMGFSSITDDKIETGVRALSEVVGGLQGKTR